MIHVNNSRLKALLIGSAIVTLLVGCASSGSNQNSGTSQSAAAAAPELPAPKKTILVFDADANQAYEVLGEVDTTLTDQRIYNYEGSKDQAREHLKRVAYAKYGDRLDAIISYRVVTTVGGGGFWGAMGAAYGAKNTDVRANGVAIHFSKRQSPQNAASQAPIEASKADPLFKPLTTTEIQKQLLALGYQAGTADGVMGKRTIDALRKFQKDNNLPQSGQADSETAGILRQKTGAIAAK